MVYFVYFNHLCEAVVQTYQITGLKLVFRFLLGTASNLEPLATREEILHII